MNIANHSLPSRNNCFADFNWIVDESKGLYRAVSENLAERSSIIAKFICDIRIKMFVSLFSTPAIILCEKPVLMPFHLQLDKTGANGGI